jgi:hypothetical protein
MIEGSGSGRPEKSGQNRLTDLQQDGLTLKNILPLLSWFTRKCIFTELDVVSSLEMLNGGLRRNLPVLQNCNSYELYLFCKILRILVT